MTLREITQRISEMQQLAGKDAAAALAENRRLFVDLARQDEIFIVPAELVSDEDLLHGRFLPCIAPAQSHDPRAFIRVFSHEDAAAAFAATHHCVGTHKIDGVELMQLSKFYFLRGSFGLLLNDGLAWAAISFPDFLSGCFQDILGDSTLVRTEYVTLVEFINMVRQNEFYHLSVGHQLIKGADDPEKIFFLSPQKKDRFEGLDYVFEELSIPKLLQSAAAHETAHVHIRTDKSSIQVSSSMLRAAFKATGIIFSESDAFYTDIDFHTDSIALDFRLSDFPSQERSMLEGFQLAELPTPHEEAPESEDSEKKEKKSFVNELYKHIKQFRRPLKDEAANQEKDKHPQRKRARLPYKKIAAGILSTVLTLTVFIGANMLLKPSPEYRLRNCISEGRYTEVAEKYDICIEKKPDTKDELLKEMTEDLNARLTAYAADDISAENLRTAIDGYRPIKEMQSVVASTYQTASALEQSKLAYEQGENELLVTDKLNKWRSVLKSDTGSQSKMAETLEKQALLYKGTIFLLVDSKEPLDAISDLMLLQSYYPNDTDISDKIREIQESAKKPTATIPEVEEPDNSGSFAPETTMESSDSPILIQKMYAQNVGFNGRQDLCILWENTSGKEIATVNFKVYACDKTGEKIATYLDNGDYYIYYVAEDSAGGYEDGYSTKTAHTWTKVWNSTTLSSVHLDMVSITYADGSVETIANVEDLHNLFENFERR